MKEKSIKGITLVALVVTIIILLILAGVAITALTQTGLFENAKQAKNAMENAQNTENITLQSYENKINQIISNVNSSNSEIKKNDDIILSSKEEVPCKTIEEYNFDINIGYIIEFDYCCKNGTNQFDVDLYPDTLPQILIIADTTSKHYKWFVYSENEDMKIARLRFFDDVQEENESDIVISNLKVNMAKDVQKNIDTGFKSKIELLGDEEVPCSQSNILKLEKNKTYILEFDYYCKSGQNKFDVDFFPDTLPEIHPTATTIKKQYIWEISTSSQDIENCLLRFFDDIQESSESDIVISNIALYEL